MTDLPVIDIHAHILPDLDDGSPSWEDSLEMAAQAVDSGVTAIVATSHANLPGQSGSWEKAKYQRQLEQFRWLLESEGMALKVYSGMEIYGDGNFIWRLKSRELLTLGNTGYVLVEFPMNGPAGDIYTKLDQILQIDLIPVLAHPERYACVQRVPAHVQEWRAMGAVIQMNKGSILGSFGRRIQRTADSLLRHRMVDVAASDAHSPWHRTTDMELLAQTLGDHYGDACPRLLLWENPEKILKGRKIFREEMIPYDYS